MNRKLKSFHAHHISVEQAQNWVAGFETGVFFHSNYNEAQYWEWLAAVSPIELIEAPAGSAFELLRSALDRSNDWWFGFLSYDMKNEIERLTSSQADHLQWPDLFFFRPQIIVGQKDHTIYIYTDDTTTPDAVWQQIRAAETIIVQPSAEVRLQPRWDKTTYCATVDRLRSHIIDGDIYEINLCQEFYAENQAFEPLSVFNRLNQRAQSPFSAWFRRGSRYLLSASPERFLKKTGVRLISQPIKGTRSRSENPIMDQQNKSSLYHSDKDRAENVMIVDLVRNDLAKVCLPGTVDVDELFGIYTFQTVHQMISTISGQLRPDMHGVDALRATFPMGSMTGAPKVRAMQLAEQYEHFRRGLYSGAVGYFDPSGDFDFNVVIRSIQHRTDTGYTSCGVGGAIVYDSKPEEEYIECLVKLAAMDYALGPTLETHIDQYRQFGK